jgi:hypothetical protein
MRSIVEGARGDGQTSNLSHKGARVGRRLLSASETQADPPRQKI